MGIFLELLEKRRARLPDDAKVILSGSKSFEVFDNVIQLSVAAAGGENCNLFEVSFSLPDNTIFTEATEHKVITGFRPTAPKHI